MSLENRIWILCLIQLWHCRLLSVWLRLVSFDMWCMALLATYKISNCWHFDLFGCYSVSVTVSLPMLIAVWFRCVIVSCVPCRVSCHMSGKTLSDPTWTATTAWLSVANQRIMSILQRWLTLGRSHSLQERMLPETVQCTGLSFNCTFIGTQQICHSKWHFFMCPKSRISSIILSRILIFVQNWFIYRKVFNLQTDKYVLISKCVKGSAAFLYIAVDRRCFIEKLKCF